MSFLDNYEDVAARIRRLHETYPNNKIHTAILDFSAELGNILVECRIYRNAEDTDPAGIDFAFGSQAAYNANMKKWFVEDTVTSAIGRCAGLVLGSETRPTKENMQEVERLDAKTAKLANDPWTIKPELPTAGDALAEIASKLGGEIQPEAPQCKHGHRVWREGTSAKTGKAWANYSCVERKPNQCDPIWYVLTSDGTFKVQI